MVFRGTKAAYFVLIQAASFAASAVVLHGAGLLAIATLSSAIALALSLRCRNERWWHIIHAAFPIAAAGLAPLHVPPLYFLAAFLILAGFNWHAARNRVPYFPSGKVTWDAVAECLPKSGEFFFVDIGSGLGGLNFYLAKGFPGGRFIGVEISPIPWFISRMRSVFSGGRCRFRRQDYNELDLGQFDVVFAYLSPAVMPALWEKARREMKPGSMLLSFEFTVPGVKPTGVLAGGMGGRPLYRWTVG